MSYSGTGDIPAVQPIPSRWYQQKAVELQHIAAARSGMGATAIERGFHPIVGPSRRGGGTIVERGAFARRMSAFPRRWGFGASEYEAPPPGQLNVGLVLGWVAVLAVGAGLFYAASQGIGTGRRVKANRRRSSRRRSSARRRSTRRNPRRRSTQLGGSGRRRTGHGTYSIDRGTTLRANTKRRRSSRRNPRRGSALYWGYDRSRRMWFYDAPNGKRYYSKARTEDTAKRVAKQAGLRTRRDDGRPEREFRERFGMSRAQYGKKYLRRNAGRRTTRNKELQKLIKKARASGWTVSRSGGGHLKWTPKDPSKNIITSGSTPSDHRAIKNLISQLRRAGLDV